MEPDVLVQGKWFGERGTIIRVPVASQPICRSKGADWIATEKCMIMWWHAQGSTQKIRKVQVFEDGDSKPNTHQ